MSIFNGWGSGRCHVSRRVQVRVFGQLGLALRRSLMHVVGHSVSRKTSISSNILCIEVWGCQAAGPSPSPYQILVSMYVTIERQGLGLGGFLKHLCKESIGQRHVLKQRDGRTATLTRTTRPSRKRSLSGARMISGTTLRIVNCGTANTKEGFGLFQFYGVDFDWDTSVAMAPGTLEQCPNGRRHWNA